MFNLFELNNLDDFVYLLNTIGEEVKINDNKDKKQVLITNTGSNFNEKYITTLTPIQTGNLIDYNNKKWLITSELAGKRYHKYKGVMQHLNNTVFVYFDEDDYKQFSCIFQNKTLDVTSNQYIRFPVDKVIITLQQNEETEQIKINDYFPKWGYKWDIIGIDKTIPGLLFLHAEMTTKPLEEPVKKENWYIDISGLSGNEIIVENEVQFTATVFDKNDKELEGETVVWSLNEEAESTIDQDGNFVANNEPEEVTITVELESDPNIKEAKQIEVVEENGNWW